MTAEVVDLAARREIRRLRREVDAMREQLDRARFQSDPKLSRTVTLSLILELENQHRSQLKRLRPVLLELIELHGLLDDPPTDTMTSAFNVALATAGTLEQSDLINKLPERIEQRRAGQFAQYQRLLKLWGPGLFEQA